MLLERRDFRQHVREYLSQQGIVGEEIENLLQDLSRDFIRINEFTRNILSIPQKAFNYLKELFKVCRNKKIT